MNTELSRHEAAKHALAECRSVDEVKDIRDKAMAMRVYAKQASDYSLERDAMEIRLRAERRLGQMMREQPKATGTRGQGNPDWLGGVSQTPPSEPQPVTLAEAGIDKNLAKRSRSLARMTDEEFEERIKTVRETRSFIEQVISQPNTELQEVLDALAIAEFKLRRVPDRQPPELIKRLVAKLDALQKLSMKLTQTQENVICLRK
jgi:hypothetical protein